MENNSFKSAWHTFSHQSMSSFQYLENLYTFIQKSSKLYNWVHNKPQFAQTHTSLISKPCNLALKVSHRSPIERVVKCFLPDLVKMLNSQIVVVIEEKVNFFILQDTWPVFKLLKIFGFFPINKVCPRNGNISLQPTRLWKSVMIQSIWLVVLFIPMIGNNNQLILAHYLKLGSWNNKWQKCAGMGLNGFIIQKK